LLKGRRNAEQEESMTTRGMSLFAIPAVLLVSGAAWSYTKSGSGGLAYYPSETQCFERTYGRVNAVENAAIGCSGSKYWTIDVQNDAPGTKTFRVAGKTEWSVLSDPGTTTCAAIVMNATTGYQVRWTAHQVINPYSGWKTLGSLPVDTDENVQFECYLSPVVYSGPYPGYVSNVAF
jgi:hypothetical protein